MTTERPTVWVALALFLSTAALFIQGAAPGATPGDAGEFIAAAGSLSIPHAPSFPLYVLLAKAFVSVIPFGAVPYRVVLFSAVCTAFGTTMGFVFLHRATGRLITSLLCAVTVTLAAPMWMNATVAEVFALHRLVVAGLLLIITLAAQGIIRPETAAVFFAFAGGATAGNHQTVVFAAPAYLVFAWLIRPFRRFLSVTFVAVLFSILGFSVFLMLPVRSAKNPPLDWGHPTTVERLYRSVARKDYGTLTLALGEKPARTWGNAARQVGRFGRHLATEAGWPLTVLGVAGLALGLRKRQPIAIAGAMLLISSGPIFFLLGNLPFDAQSEGVVQRFYISPILALAAGCAAFIAAAPRLAGGLAIVGIALGLGNAGAASYRRHTIVSDAAVSMLRAVPPGAALFLDGGDDAFYGLATELYVNGRGPSVAVHDRGGLVFPNPYGADFRAMSREEKKARREFVERNTLGEKPVFFFTMDRAIMPGVPLRSRAFLYEADGKGDGYDWRLACVRGVYPPAGQDYRTRALAAFFPYRRGVDLLETAPEQALRHFRRAAMIAGDAEWLRVNLGRTYAESAHDWLTKGKLELARAAYLDAIELDGGSESTMNNLGVVFERSGNLEEAMRWYTAAAERYPSSYDPLYNLAVIHWRRGEWLDAAVNFAEVVRRKPDHPTAAGYLAEARRRGGAPR